VQRRGDKQQRNSRNFPSFPAPARSGIINKGNRNRKKKKRGGKEGGGGGRGRGAGKRPKQKTGLIIKTIAVWKKVGRKRGFAEKPIKNRWLFTGQQGTNGWEVQLEKTSETKKKKNCKSSLEKIDFLKGGGRGVRNQARRLTEMGTGTGKGKRDTVICKILNFVWGFESHK